MPIFDVRSITVILCVISLLQTVSLAAYYVAVVRYPGVKLWIWAGVADTLGFALLVLRDRIPDLLSVIVGNGILLLSALLLHQGLLRFTGQDQPLQRYLTRALVLATVLGLIPFTFVLPDTSARTMLIGLCVAVINGLNCWNLLQVTSPALRLSFRYTATVAGMYGVWMFTRALLAAFEAPLQGVFQPVLVQALHFLVITLATIFRTVGLFAMCTQRLQLDRSEARALQPEAAQSVAAGTNVEH